MYSQGCPPLVSLGTQTRLEHLPYAHWFSGLPCNMEITVPILQRKEREVCRDYNTYWRPHSPGTWIQTQFSPPLKPGLSLLQHRPSTDMGMFCDPNIPTDCPGPWHGPWRQGEICLDRLCGMTTGQVHYFCSGTVVSAQGQEVRRLRDEQWIISVTERDLLTKREEIMLRSWKEGDFLLWHCEDTLGCWARSSSVCQLYEDRDGFTLISCCVSKA